MPPHEKKIYKPVLDVADTSHCIKAIISSYGRNPAGKKEHNIQILKEIADGSGISASQVLGQHGIKYVFEEPHK